MKTSLVMLVFAVGVALGFHSSERIFAQEREWDQTKALQMVNKVLETEQKGAGWNRIDWTTDVETAVEQAQREKKPIFVYWYVKKVDSAANKDLEIVSTKDSKEVEKSLC